MEGLSRCTTQLYMIMQKADENLSWDHSAIKLAAEANLCDPVHFKLSDQITQKITENHMKNLHTK